MKSILQRKAQKFSFRRLALRKKSRFTFVVLLRGFLCSVSFNLTHLLAEFAMKSILLILFLYFISEGLCFADASSHFEEKKIPNRILFIGNSYLFYNDGVSNHVKRMTDEMFPEKAHLFSYKLATISGARLEHHNLDWLLDTKKVGVKDQFDLVILQGHSGASLSEESRKKFYYQTGLKIKKIRASGGKAALYMTPAYVEPHELHDANMLNMIQETYIKSGNNYQVPVIPVGLAFERAYQMRPKLTLHKKFDGSHPDLLGTYLAACVVFASVFNITPEGLHYDYYGAISTTDRIFLQKIAKETVDAFVGEEYNELR